MEWKYVKKLTSEKLIDEFETLVEFAFPTDFKQCITEHNGGRPEKKAFLSASKTERILKSFLSFNHEDKENVWKIAEWNSDELTGKYVAFAIDNFGNLICFDISTAAVVFIDIENGKTEQIAKSFSEFMSSLTM